MTEGSVPATDRPGRVTTVGLATLAAAGVTLAAGAIVWRLTGGIFEGPREDDVFGLVLLGLSMVAGSLICLRSREGWRTLGVILAATAGYVVVAIGSLALG